MQKSSVGLIKDYWSDDDRPISMLEFKALSKSDREEIADLIAEEKGYTRLEDGRYEIPE